MQKTLENGRRAAVDLAEHDAVAFEDAGYRYEAGSDAFSHVSLSVKPGSFVCIVGENGSGKSTLARHIDALLLPSEGSVRVFGQDTRDSAGTALARRRCGLVFQNPDDQLVASIVEDDVAFGPENLGVEPAEIACRVESALETVGLSGFEKREVHTLSGGQKQRLAIAGALACSPDVLVLDEPTAMLDPRGRRMVMEALGRLKNRGTTVILVTHFMDEAARADRVIALHRGSVRLDGAPDDVLVRSEALRKIGLEPPLACRMAEALRERGVQAEAVVSPDALADELGRMIAEKQERKSAAAAYGTCRGGQTAPDEAASSTGCNEQTAPEKAVGSTCRGGQATLGETCDAAAGEPAIGAACASDPAPSDADIVIKLENVGFTYDDARTRKKTPDRVTWALRDVAFDIRRGEILGIAGRTGSGKSTLIRHLNGLVSPAEGRVLLDGEDLAGKHAAAAARRRVGVVFQYPETQLFAATVFDDVAFGPRNLGLSPEEVEARVHEALAAVHLDSPGIFEASPFSLSGGQQRRVAIAGVLACAPQILVLDEPAAGLDPVSHQRLLDLVVELRQTRGLTVVAVSHDMADLARIADRVLVLDGGRMRALGTPERVFADGELLAQAGLEPPAPQMLAARLRDRGFALGRPFYSELALVADIARELAAGA